MGLFISCSVSNITLIDRTKTSAILLAPYANLNMDKSYVGSDTNSRCQRFFTPFGFPIHGNFCDDEMLTNIQEDNNTKMLESYFGISIEEIIRLVNSDNSSDSYKNHMCETKYELISSLGITYIHTDILQFMQNGWDTLLTDDSEYESRLIQQEFTDLLSVLDKEPTDKLISLEYKDQYKAIQNEISNCQDLRHKNKLLMKLCSISFKEPPKTYCDGVIHNMFRKLPISTNEFKKEILQMGQFLINMDKSNKLLMPSTLVGQEVHLGYISELAEYTSKVASENWSRYKTK